MSYPRLAFTSWLILGIPLFVGAADEPSPDLNFEQPGVQLTLLAEHPDVVTPTGIDVDSDGSVWVVASHTHFRPDDYEGPEHDEIVVFSPDGERRVFYTQTDATMDLELGDDEWVYLAERDRILRVRDSDGDGVGDQEETLADLETEGDYPHNGLAGLAWHPDGDLIFSLGENFWKEWTLRGPDGAAVQGTGEGGVFRCRPDGRQLRRIAKGFWNPFGICVRKDGTIFAAENDPGARPPCRLLHVVEGGDYGYQRLYGSAPHHPFVCWDGQLRGTLPMLHPVGEAPCGVAPLGNGLIVPSWTEHRIDFYPLRAVGASFESERRVLVRGGDYFRPTCITQASPTVFYLADWVVGSYELHGKGRVWKLEIDPAAAQWLGPLELAPPTETALLADRLRRGTSDKSSEELFRLADSKDAFLSLAAIDALAHRAEQFTTESASALTPDQRISLLLAIRKAYPNDQEWIRHFWSDDDPDIQFETLRWIADEQLVDFLPEVEEKLSRISDDYRLFEACLAARNTLSGNPRAGVTDPEVLLQQLRDEEASTITRAFALRLIDPAHPGLDDALFDKLLAVGDVELLREAVRTLAARGTPEARRRLMQIATQAGHDERTRADAIAGLANPSPEEIAVLLELAANEARVLREEALRAVRFAALTEPQIAMLKSLREKYPDSGDLIAAALDPTTLTQGRPEPTDTAAWRERLEAIGNPADREAGRRIFYHAAVGKCSSCHRRDGRGNVVGPDLSASAELGGRTPLLVALLQPSKEVAPQYFPRALITADGRTFVGILLRDGGGGREIYRDNMGREQSFQTDEIEIRRELTTSMMPEGLVETMTDREIRDLLAYLSGPEADTADRFIGTWGLDFADGYGGWLEIREDADGLAGQLLWRVGSPRPLTSVQLDQGELRLARRRGKQTQRYTVSRTGETITIVAGDEENSPATDQIATGVRLPPMPPRPDLDRVRFGEPIELFNGSNLDGWRLQPADARNGWSVQEGVLVNETPKQDFSAYGSYGNLRTEQTFTDFRLHIEFNVGSQRNSGVYLRGLYEAQVVDRDSSMQGINGPGAIFGRIAPTTNAGLPGGAWQSYDLTLVDRHVTVVLNDELVIDNQPVEGCTGGALFGDVTQPGPIYLQGDHTSVRYRNIRLRPRLEK